MITIEGLIFFPVLTQILQLTKQRKHENTKLWPNTVNDRKPDRQVFEWSFSGQFLGPVFELSTTLLTFKNQTKIVLFSKWSC
jgi:hypothetical protein